MRHERPNVFSPYNPSLFSGFVLARPVCFVHYGIHSDFQKGDYDMRFLFRLLCCLTLCVLLVSCFGTEKTGRSSVSSANALNISVDLDVLTGPLMWGAIGWLYGLGDNSSLSDALITGLVHPQYTSQMAPGGKQHPDGDALKVASQFKRVGGKGIGIYVQDFYAQWPYPEYGIEQYLDKVVDPVCASVVADPNRDYFHYVPFNEPDWIWYGFSGEKFSCFLNDWKAVYERIKTNDPGAKIAGPNFTVYNAEAFRAFMEFAKKNACLPDITTWHELDGSLFSAWYDHYNDYRSLETELGLTKKDIFINEYSRNKNDLNNPGNLIQYIARFENSKVWGGLSFWTGVGTLNDLVANSTKAQNVVGKSQNKPDGAWYLYQWYGQMAGETAQVTLPDRNGPLQALASRNNDAVSILFGGATNKFEVYSVKIRVNGLTQPAVRYRVLETNNTGTDPAKKPATIQSGKMTVTSGSISVTVQGCKAESAYNLLIERK